MKLLKRFGYYLIGLSLGCILVLFIWKGKDVSFPYGPDARTLSSIRKKQIEYSSSAETIMAKAEIDTLAIQSILQTGDVDFGKSKARQEPCAEYYISGSYKEKNIDFYVKRCDSIATIETVWVKE
jgi:hypothetical protein